LGFAQSVLVPVSGLLGADERVLPLVVLDERIEPLRSTGIEAELIFASAKVAEAAVMAARASKREDAWTMMEKREWVERVLKRRKAL